MTTVALLLSARVICAFSFVSLWLMFFSICCCLLYVLWLVLYICLGFFGCHYAECVLFSCFQQSNSFLRFKNEVGTVFLVVVGCCTAVQSPVVFALLW